MKIPSVITIDYETYGIMQRPKYPPAPVGVAIKWPGKASQYYAWGHPVGNNCDKETAIRALESAFASNYGLLFHHAKFDIDVGEVYLGLPRLSWERYHDTQYLLFLSDPHAQSFSLKPSAERLLGWAPDEQDAVKQWLLKNQPPQAGEKITSGNAGAYICLAPGKLVSAYAKGDTDRTYGLFKLLYKQVADRGMLGAYDTERELMPILLNNERDGIRVDVKALEADFAMYKLAKEKVDNWLRKKLKVKDINLDSNEELADALDKAGIVTEWVLTPTGKRSTSKENMSVASFKCKKTAALLAYRSKLSTCMQTFMEPWLITARETNGIIHTTWNQVRQYGNGNKSKGTRTGRLSSSPNFQNIPTDLDDKDDGYAHPAFLELPELPTMRNYLVPDKGCLWGKRDYNQQELRILAHFEDDVLKAAYEENPRMDMHKYVGDKITAIVQKTYERRMVKIINFGIIYGKGVGLLAEEMKCTTEVAKELKDAHAKAVPGAKELGKLIKESSKKGEPIVTWNGRQYFVEPPARIGNRLVTFEYKLLNYLIQGSAADCTKRSIIRYNDMKKEGRFLATVHDENNFSAPAKAMKEEMLIMKKAMEDIKFDVPMLSDGFTGKSWGTIKEYKD